MTPAPGVSVAYSSWFGIVQGTIFRAAAEVFWFTVDRGAPGAEQLPEAFLGWTHRAILCDGVWRAGHEMLRVDVGAPATSRGPRDEPSEADLLTAEVDSCEPLLLQRRWYPMTYLALPSMLGRVDRLLARLAAYDGPERERVEALHARLARLRAGFKNIGGGLRSAATRT